MPPARAALHRITEWYARVAYGQWEGGSVLPYYCDDRRVGHFAVRPTLLAAGHEDALFKLLVTMGLYQARRDVDVMAIQRRVPSQVVGSLTEPRRLRVLVESHRCPHLKSASMFDEGCSVKLARGGKTRQVTCDAHPSARCHVKTAATAFRRMADLGKMPTSAYLHLVARTSFSELLERVRGLQPAARADFLVAEVTRVFRVGTKLATMFVSALATPALAMGLTPWHPMVDASHLLVVDGNVAHVVDHLRGSGARTYAARSAWLRLAAGRIDLTKVREDWPRRSPRLVQQAIYMFRSRSNRAAHHDPCATASAPCAGCVEAICPFVRKADQKRKLRREA